MRSESGFSLIELIVATALLLIVSSIVTSALLQMTNSQTDDLEPHRDAQRHPRRDRAAAAGGRPGRARIALPTAGARWPAASGRRGELRSGVAGDERRDRRRQLGGRACSPRRDASSVRAADDARRRQSRKSSSSRRSIPAPRHRRFTACFTKAHAVGTVLAPLGGFATGIIPPTGILNGSSDNVLKMFGDINGDGNMVYVEYTLRQRTARITSIAT